LKKPISEDLRRTSKGLARGRKSEHQTSEERLHTIKTFEDGRGGGGGGGGKGVLKIRGRGEDAFPLKGNLPVPGRRGGSPGWGAQYIRMEKRLVNEKEGELRSTNLLLGGKLIC